MGGILPLEERRGALFALVYMLTRCLLHVGAPALCRQPRYHHVWQLRGHVLKGEEELENRDGWEKKEERIQVLWFNLTCQDLTNCFFFLDRWFEVQNEGTEGSFRADVGDSLLFPGCMRRGGGGVGVARITEMILPFILALNRAPSSLPKPC